MGIARKLQVGLIHQHQYFVVALTTAAAHAGLIVNAIAT
jgi:hypothetical protein